MTKFYAFTKKDTTIIITDKKIIISNKKINKTFENESFNRLNAEHIAMLNVGVLKASDISDEEILKSSERIINSWGIVNN